MMRLPTDPATLMWQLHADKLMLVRDFGIETAPIGFATVASWFNHTPPNSLDLEYAIQLIEDALFPLKAHCVGAEHILSNDAILQKIAKQMGHENTLTRAAYEQYFDQMASHLNRPMAWAQDGLTQHECAYVLILREAMHHLNFSAIGVLG